MAASPAATNGHDNVQPNEKWKKEESEDVAMPPAIGSEGANPPRSGDRTTAPGDVRQDDSMSQATFDSSGKPDMVHRGEKQIKPNKVYIGGLPEHTRKEDLESCFGKIGNITNIELKVGYGFVEFDNREAAEESVAKYHEGYFMGNKIRVELSHGGGRTAKYSNDPGACFKCGEVGHWARECPNTGDMRRGGPPLIDRIQPTRDYLPPPPRDYAPYDYARYPPRDPRFGYDYPPLPPPPPPPASRDFRRPPSPSRDYRDYPSPPVARASREPDDYRLRGPPPPPPPPPARYDSRGYYAEPDLPPPGYPSRYPPPPPPRDYYDRYERRGPPPSERFAPYPPPGERYAPYSGAGARPRSPPPRPRDVELDRAPRDYPLGSSEYSRPEYPRGGSAERFRRRSQSPPPRSTNSGYDSGYPPTSGPSYKGGGGGFPGNGYSSGPPPPASRASSARDYPPPRPRDDDSGYRRL